MRGSDEDILRLLKEVEDAEDRVDALAREVQGPAEEPTFDPCAFCGEPAQHVASCAACHEGGCLPPDLWSPGMRDPCLSICVRCGRELHLACAADDGAGNPRCPTCRY